MKTAKIKKYLKEHSSEIKVAVGILAVTVGAGVIGYVIGNHNLRHNEVSVSSEAIKKVLTDIPNGTKVNIFGGINRAGLTTEALGELGEAMVNEGATNTDIFTHFVAIGKSVES